jgi:hypothetical protein
LTVVAVRRIGVTLALALLASLARAGDVELFPEGAAVLEGAYYAPSEDAFVWDTWIGAGAGLLRVKATTGYVAADVETILGRERRPFDANQVSYHLEGGLRVRVRRHLFVPFFHHVSRHRIDRPKTRLVDWNILGLRVVGPLPRTLPLSGRYAASVGRAIHWRAVGYGWELRGALDLGILRRSWGVAYLRADARIVTVEEGTSLPRGNFADFRGEGGVRLGPAERTVDLFVAYEHRNDVLLLAPAARDRALFGVRAGLAPGAAAGPSPPLSFPGPSAR